MSSRNMHAVEETMIGSVFDKARYHKIPIMPFMEKEFYYDRGSTFANFCEMMGTINCLRWFISLPYSR